MGPVEAEVEERVKAKNEANWNKWYTEPLPFPTLPEPLIHLYRSITDPHVLHSYVYPPFP